MRMSKIETVVAGHSGTGETLHSVTYAGARFVTGNAVTVSAPPSIVSGISNMRRQPENDGLERDKGDVLMGCGRGTLSAPALAPA